MSNDWNETDAQDMVNGHKPETQDTDLGNTVERNLAALRKMAATYGKEPQPQEPAEQHSTEPAVEQPEPADDLEKTQVFTDVAKTVQEEALPHNSEASTVPLEDTVVLDKKELPVSRRTRASQQKRKSHKKKQEKTSHRVASVVVLLILVAIGFGIWRGYTYVTDALQPVDKSATEFVQIEIPAGSTTADIGDILQKNKLIKNAQIFSLYARLKSYNDFKSGFYNLKQSMTIDELAKALQENGAAKAEKPVVGRVRVIEGYTLEQIAKAVSDNVMTKDKEDKTPFTEKAFLNAAKDEKFIAKMVKKYPNLLGNLPSKDSGVKYRLEGYLYPATYDYHDDTTVEQLIEQMLGAMDANLQSYYSQMSALGMNVHEILTLASLVEKEGSFDEDRRNIASVFYNRLANNIPLQSNIAILYAEGQLGKKTSLERDTQIDTAIDSPYNIYTNIGLMPGPVDSPSLKAIEWTVKPNDTDYFYFVADVTTKNVYFAKTYEEHEKNVEKYINSHLDSANN